jgi:hypothetical protein
MSSSDDDVIVQGSTAIALLPTRRGAVGGSNHAVSQERIPAVICFIVSTSNARWDAELQSASCQSFRDKVDNIRQEIGLDPIAFLPEEVAVASRSDLSDIVVYGLCAMRAYSFPGDNVSVDMLEADTRGILDPFLGAASLCIGSKLTQRKRTKRDLLLFPIL